MVTLTLENENQDFLKAIKAMAKAVNIKLKIQKNQTSILEESIKQVENGEVEHYKSLEDFKKAMEK